MNLNKHSKRKKNEFEQKLNAKDLEMNEVKLQLQTQKNELEQTKKAQKTEIEQKVKEELKIQEASFLKMFEDFRAELNASQNKPHQSSLVTPPPVAVAPPSVARNPHIFLNQAPNQPPNAEEEPNPAPSLASSWKKCIIS